MKSKKAQLHNAQARMKFRYWFVKRYRPNLRLVAEDIGINHNTLRNFMNGYFDLNEDHLQLVNDFLAEELQQYSKKGSQQEVTKV